MMKLAIIPVTPFQQNCSLVWDDETGIGAVVDPGGDVERILAAATEYGVKIEKALITHGHLDHAGSTRDIADRLGIPIEGPHREDLFLIEGMPKQASMYGFTGKVQAFQPDRWLDHGDKVQVGTLDFDVIHCPGHTPGHVVFFSEKGRLALVGDVLFHGSIGRTDFPRGDHEALISSIRNRLFPLGDDVQFVPGHGQMSTFGYERKANPYVSDLAIEASQA